MRPTLPTAGAFLLLICALCVLFVWNGELIEYGMGGGVQFGQLLQLDANLTHRDIAQPRLVVYWTKFFSSPFVEKVRQNSNQLQIYPDASLPIHTA